MCTQGLAQESPAPEKQGRFRSVSAAVDKWLSKENRALARRLQSARLKEQPGCRRSRADG